MNKEEFLIRLEDVLQTDEVLSFDTVLEDLDEWDSLSKLATLAFLDKEFNKKVTINEINKYVVVKDIANEVDLDE